MKANSLLLLAAALAGILLAACGADQHAEGIPSASSSPVQTPAAQVQMATPAPTATPLERPIGILVVNADGSGLRQVWDGDAVALSWSPDGRFIAFADRVTPTHDVTLLDLETGAARDLGPTSPSAIKWSPNGRSLLVGVSGEEPTHRFLETIDLTNGQRQRLTEGIYGEWSPDGTRVAFSGPECQRRNDWRVLDLATGQITDVLPTYPNAAVSISPDWKRIAYFKEPPPADVPNAGVPLYVADFDGSNERMLPTGPLRYAWPDWSPDGKWLTYGASLENQRPYLVPSDGSALPIALADQGYVYGWSTDSSMLVINGDEGVTIYRVADGQRFSVRDKPASTIEWSPDGSSLAFTASAPGQDPSDLYIYDLATRAIRKFTDAPVYTAAPKWSPDGRRIAFLGIVGGYDYGPCL
jgi:Tol biopolymer transport system component